MYKDKTINVEDCDTVKLHAAPIANCKTGIKYIDSILETDSRVVIFKIIKLQAITRGFLFRKNENIQDIKKTILPHYIPNLKFQIISSNRISKEDLNAVYSKYPPREKTPYLVELTVQYENGDLYSGEISKDCMKKQGRGIYIWNDGSKYQGYFKNDRLDYKGKYSKLDGCYYEGDIVQNKSHGFGTFKHIDGALYEGEWVNDRQNGKGKETWADGAFYDGYFRNGKKSGKGKFYWVDESQYEGDFLNNNIHGYGKVN